MAKFGWCLEPLPHQNCRREFKSSMTGKTYVCSCPCHIDNTESLKELI